jgi:hypothetical protein
MGFKAAMEKFNHYVVNGKQVRIPNRLDALGLKVMMLTGFTSY